MKKSVCILFFLAASLQSQSQMLPRRELCEGIIDPASALTSSQRSRASSVLVSSRIEPIAIRKGVDEFRIMLGISESNVDSIEMWSLAFDVLPFDLLHRGEKVEVLRLYDDGTHGDDIANDLVFTVTDLALTATDTSAGPIYGYAIRFTNITLIFEDGHSATRLEDLGLILHYYDPAVVAIPQTTRLAEEVQTTDYVVNIVAPLLGVYPQQHIDTRNVAKRFYDFFPDDRDFLILAQTFSAPSGGSIAYNPVSNAVTGIGWDIFDRSAEYGSTGRLNGTIMIRDGNAFPLVLTHEILHRWAVSISMDRSLNLGSLNGHWRAIQRNSTGFGEGGPYNGVYSRIEHLEGNRYQGIAENVTGEYNDLELYFMGLISSSEIDDPIETLVNPEVVDWQNYIYQAEALRRLAVGEMISVLGSRTPNHLESQKQFAAAMIVIHDRLLSEVELAYYDLLAREYEKAAAEILIRKSDGLTFAAATGGRATMTTRLSEPLTGIQTNREVPQHFRLSQNYPNPFSSKAASGSAGTTIEFELDQPAFVKLAIYDLQGKAVRTLVNAWQSSGRHKVIWDGSGERSRRNLASGLYFYELTAGRNAIRKKMALIR